MLRADDLAPDLQCLASKSLGLLEPPQFPEHVCQVVLRCHGVGMPRPEAFELVFHARSK